MATVNFMENYRKRNTDLYGGAPATSYSESEERFAVMEAIQASSNLASLVWDAQEQATTFMEANTGNMPEDMLFMEAVSGILGKIWNAIVTAFKKVADWIAQIIGRFTNRTEKKMKALVARAREIKSEAAFENNTIAKDKKAEVYTKKPYGVLFIMAAIMFDTKAIEDAIPGSKTMKEFFTGDVKSYIESYSALNDGEEGSKDGANGKRTTLTNEVSSIRGKHEWGVFTAGSEGVSKGLKALLNEGISEAKTNHKDSPIKLETIGENDKDVKATFMKNVFDGYEKEEVEGSKLLAWAKGVKDLAAIVEAFADGKGYEKATGNVKSYTELLGALRKGEKFFRDIADEYKKLSDKLGKTVDKYKTGTDEKKADVRGEANNASQLVSDIGTISAWFTGVAIQYYAVADAALNKAIDEVNGVFSLGLSIAGKASKIENEEKEEKETK